MKKILINWKHKVKLSRIINVVTTPLIEELGAFLLLLGLLTLSSCFQQAYCSPTMNFATEVRRVVYMLPIYALVAYVNIVVIYILGLSKFWLRRVYLVLILGLFFMMTIAEVCMMRTFTTVFNTTVIVLLSQTSLKEIKGFFEAYVLNDEFIYFAMLLIGSIVVAFYLYNIIAKYMCNVFIVRILMILCFIYSVTFSFVGKFREAVIGQFPYTSVGRFVQSLAIWSDGVILDVNNDSGIDFVDEQKAKPTIVLIIGESYNKHHASIYGYRLETTPQMAALQDSENLYVFNDCICPYNYTSMMLREIFSMHSFDMGEKSWADYPLVPHIMRYGGYYVSFVSNQVSAYKEDNWAANKMGVYFFNIPSISQRSFDYRNQKIYRFDDGLLDELETIRESKDVKPEFTILQLKGQHTHPSMFYPNNREIFSASDYEKKSWKTQDHIQYIVHYDNATHYNDAIVYDVCRYYSDREAVVIYLADHGEEVYDYRAYAGRTQGDMKSAEIIKYQHEIPLVIYVSDRYKSAYPDVVKRIASAVDRPFSSDNIAHTIIGLSGINTKWYDKTRDLLHKDYDTLRPRRINTGQIYSRAN